MIETTWFVFSILNLCVISSQETQNDISTQTWIHNRPFRENEINVQATNSPREKRFITFKLNDKEIDIDKDEFSISPSLRFRMEYFLNVDLPEITKEKILNFLKRKKAYFFSPKKALNDFKKYLEEGRNCFLRHICEASNYRRRAPKENWRRVLHTIITNIFGRQNFFRNSDYYQAYKWGLYGDCTLFKCNKFGFMEEIDDMGNSTTSSPSSTLGNTTIS